MKVGTLVTCTCVLGEAQGYTPLPVADHKVLMTHADGSEGETQVMFTIWYPTPEELKALNGGGHIVLGIVGIAHPPVMVKAADYKGAIVGEGGLV